MAFAEQHQLLTTFLKVLVLGSIQESDGEVPASREPFGKELDDRSELGNGLDGLKTLHQRNTSIEMFQDELGPVFCIVVALRAEGRNKQGDTDDSEEDRQE